MENTDRQYQKLAAQMQNISDEVWTQLSNFVNYPTLKLLGLSKRVLNVRVD